jgi:hypothetical protein
MNTNKSSIRNGFLLAILTIAIFLILYFLFSTQGNISELQYFNYSALINCFLLPALYAIVGFYNSYSFAKIQPLSFGQAWKLTFLPMFMGGLISLGFIFIFYNTTGAWAEDSLQRGWYELMTANPNPDFMEKNGELVENMNNLEFNMFTTKVFLISFSAIIFFYFLISSIFAVFLKNRRV